MKTFVEFRSSKFPSYDKKNGEVNPEIWGKRLAEYISQNLEKHGIKTLDIIAEDWGYYLPIQNEEARLALCCANQNGENDKFIIFTDPKTPKIRKLLRTKDITPQLSRLIDAVREILENDPDIHDIGWQEQ